MVSLLVFEERFFLLSCVFVSSSILLLILEMFSWLDKLLKVTFLMSSCIWPKSFCKQKQKSCTSENAHIVRGNKSNPKLCQKWQIRTMRNFCTTGLLLYSFTVSCPRFFFSKNDIGIMFFKTYPALCVPLLEMLNFLRCFCAKMNEIAFC